MTHFLPLCDQSTYKSIVLLKLIDEINTFTFTFTLYPHPTVFFLHFFVVTQKANVFSQKDKPCSKHETDLNQYDLHEYLEV